MKKYYEAYDSRYRIIHERGYSWSSNVPTPLVMDTIRKYSVTESSSLLEIGCGEGRDAFPLLEKGFDLLATDISPEAIQYCRSQNQAFADRFTVLDCINGTHDRHYDFIYAVAVVHMLVSDSDRNSFYQFIGNHLQQDGIALICSMGDGETETRTNTAESFDMVERDHETGPVTVPSTSLRIVSFSAFEKEITGNDLVILEKGITSSLPDFNNLMFAVVKKKQ